MTTVTTLDRSLPDEFVLKDHLIEQVWGEWGESGESGKETWCVKIQVLKDAEYFVGRGDTFNLAIRNALLGPTL